MWLQEVGLGHPALGLGCSRPWSWGLRRARRAPGWRRRGWQAGRTAAQAARPARCSGGTGRQRSRLRGPGRRRASPRRASRQRAWAAGALPQAAGARPRAAGAQPRAGPRAGGPAAQEAGTRVSSAAGALALAQEGRHLRTWRSNLAGAAAATEAARRARRRGRGLMAAGSGIAELGEAAERPSSAGPSYSGLALICEPGRRRGGARRKRGHEATRSLDRSQVAAGSARRRACHPPAFPLLGR